MNLDLECLEWINTNKSARYIKTGKKSKKSKDTSNSVYLLQITPSRLDKTKLACLTSHQIVNIYDQDKLKLISQFKGVDESSTSVLTEIGFYKQNDDMIFGCSDNGTLKCWDLRLNTTNENFKESLIFKEDREFLSADINSIDNYFAVGTNKNIDDALVYIFDIRMNEKYLHKFAESHSNDVSQVKFDPKRANKFCSGSLDGLVCLYDLEQQPEEITKIENEENDESSEEDDSDGEEDPDLMEQVFNTDSSVQKIGYISSTCTEVMDQLFAITYTNDLFVWDLNSHDLLFKHQTKNKNVENAESLNDEDEQEEDYFFDCFYMKPNLMTICRGDHNGNFKLLNGDNVIYDSLVDNRNENVSKRNHRDVIRSSYWNGENFYTAGEDGFLFKWKIFDKKSRPVDLDETKESKKRDLVDKIESDDTTDRKDKAKLNKKEYFNKSKNKSFYSKNKRNPK
ncbi:unnamed protein product [Brachionus calyciflorus]|uniref:WD repeat-containing protein 89 n=1 Tax=Brachionus calyciflorus TaxID=104777 RepID=A0A813QWJ4_9BILA|nr:unnamed protein product [Brachionus calyciflorus]